MERKRLTAEYCGIACEIEEDKPDVGAYLYIFLPDGTQYDYLQNSVLDCQEFALEECGVPMDHWRASASVFIK